MAERSLQELIMLARPALEDPEIVARVAVAALGSPTRANKVVLPSIADEELTESWRWLLVLARDSEEKYGVKFEEVLTSLLNPEFPENFEKGEITMIASQPAGQLMTLTEQYNAQVEKLCGCADGNIATRAQTVKRMGFDPTLMENILGARFDKAEKSEMVCKHCGEIYVLKMHFVFKSAPHVSVFLKIDMFAKGEPSAVLKMMVGTSTANFSFRIYRIEYDQGRQSVGLYHHSMYYYDECIASGSSGELRLQVYGADASISIRYPWGGMKPPQLDLVVASKQ